MASMERLGRAQIVFEADGVSNGRSVIHEGGLAPLGYSEISKPEPGSAKKSKDQVKLKGSKKKVVHSGAANIDHSIYRNMDSLGY